MANFLRTVEFLCLSLWLGSDVFLSFVVAPGAFRVLASRDQAGAMVGFALWWMHMIGVICGIVFLTSRFLRTRNFATLVAPATLCVVLMIVLTVASQHAVSPRMAELRAQMGSIEATEARNPLLVGVSEVAPAFGAAGERCVAGGDCGDVLAGARGRLRAVPFWGSFGAYPPIFSCTVWKLTVFQLSYV